MARFDNAIALADRLITKNGEAVMLNRRVDGAPPDPTKPWRVGAQTETTTAIRGVFLNHSEAREAGIVLKEGEQIVFVPAADLGAVVPDPATDVIVRGNGERWSVVEHETLKPNDQTIMETITVRK